MMNGAYGAANNGAISCGGGIFGLHLTTLLFVGLAILALYLFFKSKKQPIKKEPIFLSKQPSVDATEIVRLRYARGEISFEEFQNILKNIQS